MTSIDKLTELFSKFPGIGPRQAKRFAYFLLTSDENFLEKLKENISELKKEIEICQRCFRFFPKNQKTAANECRTCLDPSRDGSILMVVSRDVDFENIEKTDAFNGYYFVLGGVIPILEKEPEKKIRLEKLLEKIEKILKTGDLKEIILAFNPNPEGENTAEFIKEKLKPLKEKYSFSISTLGKGLSTGMELEYSDTETLKHALQNKS